MKLLLRSLSLVGVSLLAGSCHRPAIDPAQSLVGAKSLPAASVLSREIIEINRGVGSWDGNGLSYDLRPDNTLTVTLTGRGDSVKAKESFQLSSDVAAAARRMLWRVRPENLEGIEQAVLPSGCHSPPVDAGSEYSVIFIPADSGNQRLGVLLLPYARDCAAKNSIEAHNLIGTVLHSFPTSKVAAEYDRELPRMIVPL
jgi:hypothetical protein